MTTNGTCAGVSASPHVIMQFLPFLFIQAPK